MKTSSIALRVADFLRKYPPFEYMDEADVQRLAGLGRVKFHEAGEYVFRQGEERGPWLYVVQQGTVRIVQNTPNGIELVDMRGEGDLVGISWFMSEKTFVHSAVTDSDTLLYALPWNEFVPLTRKYPQVSRYLAAYFSLRPNYQLPDPHSSAPPGSPGSATEAADWWLSGHGPLAERARGRLLIGEPNETVRDAAWRMTSAKQEALVVADTTRRPLGIVTESDFLHRVGTGEVSLDARLESVMSRPVVTIRPGLSAGEVVLKMMHHRVRHLVVTSDGTPNSPAQGLVDQRDVQFLYGRLPLGLGVEIRDAADAAALRRLRLRTEESLRTALHERSPLQWAGELISEVDGQIVARLLEIAEAQLAAAGLPKPPVVYCWLALGAEGRKERLLRANQETALVYADPPAEIASAVHSWCLRLASLVTELLAEIGFRPSPDGLVAAQPGFCRPLSGWRETFTRWIENPIQENVTARLPVFDLRGIAGDTELAAQLHAHIAGEIARCPRFVPLAANDAFANLPPLTIFQNSVVDKDGLLWTCIDTRQHALQPLVDTARVFAWSSRGGDPLNTSARFLQAAQDLPAQHALFEDAAEAARVTLYHQALAGFLHNDDGNFIRPSELGKIDQEILKGVFRTIGQIIEFTSRHFQLKGGEAAEPAPAPAEEPVAVT